ncbi:MAG: hypothetical protein JO317_02655 [Verrucomicrobiae bacterium]|nr:hypothetical protein [Verrucomicrobiae bacterium]
MSVIFAGVVIWNAIFFAVSLLTAYFWRSADPKAWWHFSAGVTTGLFTMLTHCLVLIHMSGSSKGIKEALGAFGLEEPTRQRFAARLKRHRAQLSGYAYFCPLLVMATVFLGGWHHSKLLFHESFRFELSMQWHRAVAWATVAINLWAFWREYQIVRANTALIEEVNDLLRSRGLVRDEAQSPSDTEPEPAVS